MIIICSFFLDQQVILDLEWGETSDPSSGRKPSASMLLPLLNSDDQWCLVSVAGAPRRGLQIPGVPISIPYSTMENVCRTATSLKQRVIFPLHVVGHQSVPLSFTYLILINLFDKVVIIDCSVDRLVLN